MNGNIRVASNPGRAVLFSPPCPEPKKGKRIMARNDFIILMAEDNQHDITAMKRVWKKQKLGASAYIIKPAGIVNLSKIITAISFFWRLDELSVELNEYN